MIRTFALFIMLYSLLFSAENHNFVPIKHEKIQFFKTVKNTIDKSSKTFKRGIVYIKDKNGTQKLVFDKFSKFIKFLALSGTAKFYQNSKVGDLSFIEIYTNDYNGISYIAGKTANGKEYSVEYGEVIKQ